MSKKNEAPSDPDGASFFAKAATKPFGRPRPHRLNRKAVILSFETFDPGHHIRRAAHPVYRVAALKHPDIMIGPRVLYISLRAESLLTFEALRPYLRCEHIRHGRNVRLLRAGGRGNRGRQNQQNQHGKNFSNMHFHPPTVDLPRSDHCDAREQSLTYQGRPQAVASPIYTK